MDTPRETTLTWKCLLSLSLGTSFKGNFFSASGIKLLPLRVATPRTLNGLRNKDFMSSKFVPLQKKQVEMIEVVPLTLRGIATLTVKIGLLTSPFWKGTYAKRKEFAFREDPFSEGYYCAGKQTEVVTYLLTYNKGSFSQCCAPECCGSNYFLQFMILISTAYNNLLLF